ncbi:MAG: glycosyltransferase [Solirubrobacteraceae bacterium]|nr:glycosyltransferase [Solirubrobacteraceae bacterium]
MSEGAAEPSFAGARVAVVHDWLQGMHGSEQTVEAMVSGVFADAEACDVFTFHAAHDVLSPVLSAAVARDARITHLPGLRQRGHDPGHWRMLLAYMPRWFAALDLDGYDIVVSSSHAFAVGARPRRAGAVHLCYCYTPIRYVWQRGVDGERLDGLQARVMGALVGHLRRADLRAAAAAGDFVAISSAVAERIHAAYGRPAAVIAPPVQTDAFAPGPERDLDHFTWVHRLTPYKRPQEVVEAFRGLPQRLTMVGIGPLEAELRRGLPPNVELRGWLERAELARLLGRSGGFLHVGEEDFGISMVEALASGTPVIALDRGGATDIVRDGANGVTLSAAEPDLIRAAVRRVASSSWDRAALVASAERFSRPRFVRRMREHVAALC